MSDRFRDKQQLVDALKRQQFVSGDIEVANALARCDQIVEFRKGQTIITEGGVDNDIYLLLAGEVSISVRGIEIATRKAGHHVGEMEAIEPAQKRATTVVTNDIVVALRMSSSEFMALGQAHPQIWLSMARELSRRLYQRNDLIRPQHERSRLFIMSSTEALDVAREIETQLQADVGVITVWNHGVFFAGGYTLEALEKEVDDSDFAVAIAQPDDMLESKGRRHATLRDNVLFELGLFMGKLGRRRAVLIHPRVDGLRLPSDLSGLTLATYSHSDNPDELCHRLGPACTELRKIIKKLGIRTPTT